MPILVLVGLQAEDLVLLLFGIRWIAIAPYVTLLAVIGCFQCINSFNDSFVISQGRSDILLIVSILEKSLLVAGVIIGIRYGVTGVILAKISVLALIFIPRIITVCKLIQSNLFQWFRNIAALMAGLLLLTVVALLAINLFEDMHYAGRLFLVSLVSVGMYYLYLHLTRNTSLNEIKRIVRDQVIQLFSYAR
jgi:O-antigen/teichoic acid export membrane protein